MIVLLAGFQISRIFFYGHSHTSFNFAFLIVIDPYLHSNRSAGLPMVGHASVLLRKHFKLAGTLSTYIFLVCPFDFLTVCTIWARELCGSRCGIACSVVCLFYNHRYMILHSQGTCSATIRHLFSNSRVLRFLDLRNALEEH